MPPLLDRGRGGGLAAVAGLTLIQGIAAGAAAFATRDIFEALQRGSGPPAAGLVLLVGAGAVIAASRIGARLLGERLGQDYARQIRGALFEHAARMPAGAVARRRAGHVSLRFVGDMTAFRNWLGLGLPRLVAGAVMIPATLLVMWLLQPALAAVVAPVLGATMLLAGLGGLPLVRLQRRLRTLRARIAADMAERMPIAPQLDRLGRRGTEMTLLERRSDAMIDAALRHRIVAETLKALPDLAAGIAAALILLAGHRQGIGTASIAAALALLGLTLAPLRDLGGVWNHRAAHAAAARKAQAAMARRGRDLYRAGKPLCKVPAEVVLEDVALPSGRSLSWSVPAGARGWLPVDELDGEAVVEMLLGLDSPERGRILLSGTDLRDLSRGALRRGVLRIGAAPEILHGSLRRALLMGCRDRPDDAGLSRLACDEGLAPLIARLGGLDCTVREAGRNLTRGERIAVALVRMRLLRPRLILVDGDCAAEAWPRIERHLTACPATVICARPEAESARLVAA
ncbi:ABC transporter transmembrane domain-containing protein [Paracoccus spongiarum]|uniref:ABC transporter transmembrane domain-containing protein n=1 Tax=Paracoccus spongiarum TaxID=3064387 RepID=A0ABT9J8I0_9RHOB|nr:ABC transporter transmembrane domain-containing protein [Paracoccus sp. 2205BS29-5]MDP5306117.1 ABC transporter transmembrane domain-containing protein [Paracoccus sp. 2205BS29-5]